MPERSAPRGADAALDAFLQQIRVERGLARNTVAAYARDLARFIAHLEHVGLRDFAKLERRHITGFVEALAAEGLGARSRSRALVAVRRLLRFAAAEGLVQGEPLEGLQSPRFRPPLPRTLRSDEVAAILEAIDLSTPLGLRDRAMLELLYGAGLRVSELVALPLAAIDRRGGLVRVTGKGGAERVVPVGAAALESLERYLSQARPALLGERSDVTHATFLTRRGGPMTRQNFFALLRRHARAAGLPGDRVSPHVLRHAFATDLLEGGADLRSIQAMLGHADLSTTEIYTHVGRRKLRETVEARHPRGRARRG